MKEKDILFGAKLKQGRKASGLSQKELALRMNVTRNTVINWESDKSKPDHSLIPELCDMLGIPIASLFGADDPCSAASGSAAFSSAIPGYAANGSAAAGSAAHDTAVHSSAARDPALHSSAIPGSAAFSGAADDSYSDDSGFADNYRRLSPAGRRIVARLADALLAEELAARDEVLRNRFRLFVLEPGSAAAGAGNDIPDVPPSYAFLRSSDRNARADAVVRVNGRSMEPVYFDGDEVYIQYTRSASPGEDVVCSTADGAVIKRISSDHTLYSVNEELPYGMKHEDDNVTVLGRVLGTVSSSDRPDAADIPLLEELFSEDIRTFEKTYKISRQY